MATINLIWQNHGGSGDIQIYRKKDSGDYVLIKTLPFTATSHSDDTITLNGDYKYKIINLSGGTFSSESNTVTISSAGSGSGTAPDDLTASFDSGTNIATINWTNGTGTGNNIIERQKDSGDWAEIEGGLVISSVHTFADNSITENGNYNYRVRNELVTGYSNEDDFDVTTFGESEGDVGAKPSDLYIASYTESLGVGTLHWTNHGAVGVNVIEQSDDGSTWIEIDETDASGNSTGFAVSANGTYYFRVSNTSVATDPYTEISSFLVYSPSGGEF